MNRARDLVARAQASRDAAAQESESPAVRRLQEVFRGLSDEEHERYWTLHALTESRLLSPEAFDRAVRELVSSDLADAMEATEC